MRSEFEAMGETYSQVGDYLLPNLALPEEETAITLGRWGMKRKDWLKKNRSVLYTQLQLSGKLMQHCKEIEDSAEYVAPNLTLEPLRFYTCDGEN